MAARRLGVLFGRGLGVLRSSTFCPGMQKAVVNVDSTAFPVAQTKQILKWQNLVKKADYSNQASASLHELSACGQPVKGRTQPHVSVDPEGQTLTLSRNDGSSSRFHSAWLRHNCHCGQCRQQHSGQKLTDPASVAHDIPITSATVTGGDVELEWGGEEKHKGLVPVDYLLEHCYLPSSLRKQRQTKALDPPVQAIPKMDFEELLSGKAGVLKWLRHINEAGLAVLTNVPTESGTIIKVAENVGPVDDLIYGKLFDVVSHPKPINVAYSGVALDFHMDLVYYESPPGLQFLHCLRFDDCVVGGESRFLDVFAVAREFQSSDPDHFSTLERVPATFQKCHYERAKPVEMKYQRPHIVTNQYNEVVGVNWAPSFEGPLAVPEDDVVPYYAAYQAFAKAIMYSPHILEYKLRPGDLVTFNNRRILHARKVFELNGGSRHFEGCYVNIDHFKSTVAVFSRLYGDCQPTKRVGNNDWF